MNFSEKQELVAHFINLEVQLSVQIRAMLCTPYDDAPTSFGIEVTELYGLLTLCVAKAQRINLLTNNLEASNE